MKKQHLNEIKRLQKLAGLFENKGEYEYDDEYEERFDDGYDKDWHAIKDEVNREVDERYEERNNSLNEEEMASSGLITFEEIKQAVENEYITIEMEAMGGEEEDYIGDIKRDFDECTSIDDLVRVLDGLGFNGDEAYDYIFDSILKK